MKILKERSDCRYNTVGRFEAGEVIVTKEPVNQFCKPSDPYIIGEIPACYLRDAVPGRTTWRLQDKIAIINLRTSGFSLVNGDRPCTARPDATLSPDGVR